MLIAIATEKGGVGKTTIATNLAAMRAGRGDSVKLIDTDDAKYAHAWGQVRVEKNISPQVLVSMMRGNIYAGLVDERTHYDSVIVDVPGEDGPELRFACAAADVVVVPLRIGQFDTWSLGKMSHIANELKQVRPEVRVYVVLNAVPHTAKTELRESLAMLAEMTDFFTLASAPIIDRMAFRSAARAGKGVVELDGADPKAVEEITALYEDIYHV